MSRVQWLKKKSCPELPSSHNSDDRVIRKTYQTHNENYVRLRSNFAKHTQNSFNNPQQIAHHTIKKHERGTRFRSLLFKNTHQKLQNTSTIRQKQINTRMKLRASGCQPAKTRTKYHPTTSNRSQKHFPNTMTVTCFHSDTSLNMHQPPTTHS